MYFFISSYLETKKINTDCRWRRVHHRDVDAAEAEVTLNGLQTRRRSFISFDNRRGQFFALNRAVCCCYYYFSWTVEKDNSIKNL